MKKHIITTLCTLACAMLAPAQVPSLINYQGRLTDSNGAPVTGTKNFSLSIFDAEVGGNLLYTEAVGAVVLDANGVYNFQFGAAGTSNTQIAETIATTNGTSTMFQKVLDNEPVVAGSVSVTDGTYTWSQSTGSSNEDDFGVAFSTSLRRVTVNYYSGAPAAGTTITATYRYGTSGITGALSTGAEHWMAISVDGTPQANRQRVLAVPFAMKATNADQAIKLAQEYDLRKTLMSFSKIHAGGRNVDLARSVFQLPLSYAAVGGTGGNGSYGLQRLINNDGISKIRMIEATVINTSVSLSGLSGSGQTSISLVSISPSLGRTVVAQTSTDQSGKMILHGPFAISEENEYLIEISLFTTTGPSGNENTGVAGTSSSIQKVEYLYDTE